jgi:hypothetical protein
VCQALARVPARRYPVVDDSDGRQSALLGRQSLRRAGVVEQDEEGCHGDADSRDALYDKQPAPASYSVRAVQMARDCACEDATKGA